MFFLGLGLLGWLFILVSRMVAGIAVIIALTSGLMATILQWRI